jgi:hypothetical protein
VAQAALRAAVLCLEEAAVAQAVTVTVLLLLALVVEMALAVVVAVARAELTFSVLAQAAAALAFMAKDLVVQGVQEPFTIHTALAPGEMVAVAVVAAPMVPVVDIV